MKDCKLDKSDNCTFPVGHCDFSYIREHGLRYVDKTASVNRLVRESGYFLLCRPHGFGKSLLVLTLKAFFEGRRELFDGLYIGTQDWDWEPFPVLHLDFSLSEESSSLERALDRYLYCWEKAYGVDRTSDDVALRLADVIHGAYLQTGRRVVVLVDGYENPVTGNLFNVERRGQICSMLRRFYGMLSRCASDIRFVFLTGVVKFSGGILTGDISGLRDISMDEEYADICGFTEIELQKNFSDELRMPDRSECPQRTYEMLRSQYGGFRFAGDVPEVFSPRGLINEFSQRRMTESRSVVDTPESLVGVMVRTHYPVRELEGVMRRGCELMGQDLDLQDPIPFIYQCGYLTVTDFDRRRGLYTLGYPNREMKRRWLEWLVPLYLDCGTGRSGFDVKSFMEDVEKGEVNSFMIRLRSFLARVPYDHCPKDMSEGRLHDMVFAISVLLGLDARTEFHTSMGRIDMVVHTERRIYIFEFKLNLQARTASRQIERQGYALPYLSSGKEVVCVGVNFSSKTRNIDEWDIRRLNVPDVSII